MSLATDSQLGTYRILSPLGKGGMGEVYQARDTRLDRDVAVKVLPEIFSCDPERLARFDREAKLLASLNHPNIASIHGLEETDNVRYLVLELAPGTTLRERISNGPMPIEDAVLVARQIAAALQAAHEQGIIHRDLKPSNIMVTADDKVKVLDFGLAKAFAGDGSSTVSSNSPTITDAHHTSEGVVLGTAAYMSPEQARGKPVDKRTDIWAFGAVLYEMLAGKQAFAGETSSDVMAGILRGEPDWDALPANTPGHVQLLLRRCLQKDADRRLHDIADARIELEDSVGGSSISFSSLPLTVSEPHVTRRGLGLAGAIVVLALGAALSGLAVWQLKPQPAAPPQPVSRLSVVIGNELNVFGWSMTPDGSRIIFSANEKDESPRDRINRLYVRRLDDFAPKVVAGTDRVRDFDISPDGRWIAFSAANDSTSPVGKIKKVALDGGPPVTLYEYAENPPAVHWIANDTLALSQFPPPVLFQMPAGGGQLTEIARLDRAVEVGWFGPLAPLPGNRALLATIMGIQEQGFRSRVELISLDGQEGAQRRVILADGFGARYLPSGRLVFSREGAILAAPFDLQTLQVTGDISPVMSGLSTTNPFSSWFEFSNTGSLLYRATERASDTGKLVRVNHEGVIEPVTAAERKFQNGNISVSPDGRRIALSILNDRELPKLWIYDSQRDTLAPFAHDGLVTVSPVWTPDGNSVVYMQYDVGKGGELRRKQIGGRSESELIHRDEAENAADIGFVPNSFSTDGNVLLVTRWRFGGQDNDILALSMNEPRVATELFTGAASESDAKFSPDGNWIAYVSDETNQEEVYLTDYPDMNRRWRVSTEGGENPMWATDGSRIYFEDNEDRLVSVTVETDPAISLSNPQTLFDYEQLGLSSGFTITPDGQHFVTTQFEKTESEVTEFRVVLNWFQELDERLSHGTN